MRPATETLLASSRHSFLARLMPCMVSRSAVNLSFTASLPCSA